MLQTTNRSAIALEKEVPGNAGLPGVASTARRLQLGFLETRGHFTPAHDDLFYYCRLQSKNFFLLEPCQD
jgi:hypothetical protein